MPQTAYESLIRRNSEIPGLGPLLSAESIQAIVAHHAGADLRALTLQPTYIRLKPSSSCLVAYKGEYRGQAFHCYAKAHGTANAVKLDKAMRREAENSVLGPGRVIDSERLVNFSVFPNDMAMRGLSALLGAHPGISTLAYKPERRFVGLVGTPDQAHSVVKLYKKGSFDHARRLAELAQAIPFLPRLLRSDESQGTVHLDWIDGVTLSDAVRANSDTSPIAYAAGRLLARMHSLRLLGDIPRVRASDLSARLLEMARGVTILVPQLQTEAERILDALMPLISSNDAEPVLSHGDFYSNQIVACGDEVRFLDFDELCYAVAEADVGLYSAHLEFDVLRGRISTHSASQLADDLVRGYESVRPLDPAAIWSHTLAGMFLLAHRPFRDVMPDWPMLTALWLQRIQALINSPPCRACRSRLKAPLATSSSDPDMPQLATALGLKEGGSLVAGALATKAQGTQPIIVTSVILRRLKPGRRALLEYTVSGLASADPSMVLGKIRSKGLDIRTYALNEALFSTLSNSSLAGPLRVPQPLGIVPEMNMWLQEKVEGIDGWAALDGDLATARITRVAQALLQLHECRMPAHRTHDYSHELAILRTRLDELAESTPHLAQRVRVLRNQCRTLAARLKNRPHQGIHRDFYPDQLLMDDRVVYVLDLDLFTQGDPALDVGNFIAHVQEYDLRRFGNPYARRHLTNAFLNAYRQGSQDTDLVWAVDIYRILSLARLTQISIQFPDRHPFTEELLRFCEAQLPAAASSTSSVPITEEQ